MPFRLRALCLLTAVALAGGCGRSDAVGQLLVASRKLARAGHTDAAFATAEAALKVDPNNQAAQMLVEVLRDEVMLSASDRAWLLKAHGKSQPFVIVHQDVDTLNKRTFSLLSEKAIPRVSFMGDSLENALDFIRDSTGVNMTCLWNKLEESGIKRSTPITLQAENTTALALLDSILESASQGIPDDDRMDYMIDIGVLTVSTRRDLFPIPTP